MTSISTMTGPVFITYRRDDSSAEARSLCAALREVVGSHLVFMDTSSIPLGSEWPSSIRDALNQAETVLVVIGRDWIRSADEWGRRRLDLADDWVRQEIAAALPSGRRVIAVLIDGAKMPPQSALPEVLADLPARQHIELRRDYWDHDVKLLLAQFVTATSRGRHGSRERSIYPVDPPPGAPDPISDEKLGTVLASDLKGWEKVVSPLPEDHSQVREELCKTFAFKTFQDAIHFMTQVAPGCDVAMHHPRWENIWKSLKVSLSTWDIGHRISDRDIQLARYFDRAYRDFSGSERSS